MSFIRSSLFIAPLALALLAAVACGGTTPPAETVPTASATEGAAGAPAASAEPSAEAPVASAAPSAAPAKPAEPGDVVAVATEAKFTKLVELLGTAKLADALKGEGPFTVFAPTDEAFAKIPAKDLEKLLKDEKKLAAVLSLHVVPGKFLAAEIAKAKLETLVKGKKLTVKVKGEEVTVNGAKVTKADVPAKNGVIHVIDTVILK